jgi:peptidoglycan/LPS O-acetylase OafA/YrhL
MTGPQTNQTDRILALDGFRGLAVLMVTLYRFAEVSLTESVIGRLPSRAILVGASGVDLFFVLSGFLITGILLHSKDSPGYFSRFYSRRTLRIFPLYFASLALFLLLLPAAGVDRIVEGEKIIGTEPIRGNTSHLWLYTSNLSIAWANDWHFGALNHFWSLAIEEQFYLIWPMIVLALAPNRLFKCCLIAVVVLTCCRVGFSISATHEVASKTFTLFRMDGLLLGSAAALLYNRVGDGLIRYQTGLRVGVVLVGMLFCASLVLGSNDFTVRYFLVSLAGVLLLLATVVAVPHSPERRLFENPILRSLGRFSYAMYIFQWPLIPILAPWISPHQCSSWAGQPLSGAILYVAIMFGLTYVLAMISWYAFESWILGLRDRINISKSPATSIGSNDALSHQ